MIYGFLLRLTFNSAIMAKQTRCTLLNPKDFMKGLIDKIDDDDDSSFEAIGLDNEIPEDKLKTEHSG